jgi:hypothetical protein
MADAAGNGEELVSYEGLSSTPSLRRARAQLKSATMTELGLMSYSPKVIAKQLFHVVVAKGMRRSTEWEISR